MIKVTNKQLVLKRKEDGASLIEYAVIAALVVGIAVAAFTVLPANAQLFPEALLPMPIHVVVGLSQ